MQCKELKSFKREKRRVFQRSGKIFDARDHMGVGAAAAHIIRIVSFRKDYDTNKARTRIYMGLAAFFLVLSAIR